MTKKSFYNEAALTYRAQAWAGHALLTKGLPAWFILCFTVIFFSALTLLLSQGSYTRKITVSGELLSVPRAVHIIAPSQGFVITQFVTAGDKVKKGQSLYAIDVSKMTRSGVVSVQQRHNTEDQIKNADNIIISLKQSKVVNIAGLEAQRDSYKKSLINSGSMIKQAGDGLKEMKSNMESYRKYQHDGLITRDQLSQQSSIFYQQQNDLLTLSTQREQNELQVISLENEIRTRASDYENEILRMEMKKNELTRQLSEDDAASEIIVTSPVSGRVDSTNMTVGQSTSQGDALAQIIPGGAPHWELIMWIPDNAAPFVRIGQPVKIHYSAFPTEKFGYFPGYVSEISSSPSTYRERGGDANNTLPVENNPQNWYRLVIIPDLKNFIWQGRQIRPGNGLRADCTLSLEKRQLWQWILSPLFELSQSLKGEDNE